MSRRSSRCARTRGPRGRAGDARARHRGGRRGGRRRRPVRHRDGVRFHGSRRCVPFSLALAPVVFGARRRRCPSSTDLRHGPKLTARQIMSDHVHTAEESEEVGVVVPACSIGTSSTCRGAGWKPVGMLARHDLLKLVAAHRLPDARGMASRRRRRMSPVSRLGHSPAAACGQASPCVGSGRCPGAPRGKPSASRAARSLGRGGLHDVAIAVSPCETVCSRRYQRSSRRPLRRQGRLRP